MAERYDGDETIDRDEKVDEIPTDDVRPAGRIVSQDQLSEIGTGAPADSGRKGGAVSSTLGTGLSAADDRQNLYDRPAYRQEGPPAARAYDMTAATSERSPMLWVLPAMVILFVVGMLIWGAMQSRSGSRANVSADQSRPGQSLPADRNAVRQSGGGGAQMPNRSDF